MTADQIVSPAAGVHVRTQTTRLCGRRLHVKELNADFCSFAWVSVLPVLGPAWTNQRINGGSCSCMLIHEYLTDLVGLLSSWSQRGGCWPGGAAAVATLQLKAKTKVSPGGISESDVLNKPRKLTCSSAFTPGSDLLLADPGPEKREDLKQIWDPKILKIFEGV